MSVSFKGRHMLSSKDLSREEMDHLFDLAEKMEPIVSEGTKGDLLKDKVLGVLFFQASTRTRLSFESAMLRLGGSVLGFASPEGSRAGDQYQESMADTARTVNGYVDAIVMRHFHVAAPAEYAKYSCRPVINGGNGFGEGAEHPTQAWIDMYAMRKLFGKIDGLKILLIGDGRFRCVHSLGISLAKYKGVKLYMLAPEKAEALKTVGVVPENAWLPAPDEEEFKRHGLDYERIYRMEDVLGKVDLISCQGVAKSRNEKTPEEFRITKDKLKLAKKDVVVMHPLPRLDELDTDVDDLPNQKYFMQAHSGVPLRMALLSLVLGKAK